MKTQTVQTRPCPMCRGSHPATGPRPGATPNVEVDGIVYRLSLAPPYGNQWTFPHPDGSTADVVLFGAATMEQLACAVRHELNGPHPYQARTPADAWRRVSRHGDGRMWEKGTDAARMRCERVRAAYRLTYGVDTDEQAVRARQAHETAYHADATPGDPYGDDARARLYLHAYARVLAAYPGEQVYPVEQLAYAYADVAAEHAAS